MRLPFGDDPITAIEDDLLGRSALADVLAAEIGALDAQHGAVVAITGPWGSGKTSLMNLTAARLRQDENVLGVVEFNPWLFSGAEQLAENLLTELATQLQEQESRRDKARRIAAEATGKLLTYSRGLSVLRAVPVVGTVAEVAAQSIEGAHGILHPERSLQRRRQDAISALRDMKQRVVVLIDDIDRLTRAETRDLFRTVRLSASFPNVVYLLCLDHQVVAGALDEDGFSGKAYLEKILTVTCSVPELSDHQIGQLFIDGLNAILERHDTGPEDENMWAAVYPDIIRPLFNTVRDAKRVLASLPITLRLIGEELPVEDVVVLECLRTLYPDLHAAVDKYAEGLTAAPSPYGLERERQHLTDQVAAFVAADHRFNGHLSTALVHTLFPHAGGRLRGPRGWPSSSTPRQGGVGWKRGLAFYFTHELSPGIAPSGAVRAIVNAFGDKDALRAALSEIPDARLEDALEQIVRPAEAMAPENVAVTVEVLLELFPRLRWRREGMFRSEPKFAIIRPVFRMLQRLSQDAVQSLALRLVQVTQTCFAAFELVTLVARHENAGEAMVNKDCAEELSNLLRKRIIAAGEGLSGERDLVPMLYHSFELKESEPLLPMLVASPRVAATALKSSVSVRSSATIGNGPTVTTEEHGLHWEVLTKVYGGEENVATAAAAVIESGFADNDVELQMTLELVQRYLDGWRQSDPFSDHGGPLPGDETSGSDDIG